MNLGTGVSRRRRGARSLAAAVSLGLLAPLGLTTTALAAPGVAGPPDVQEQRVSKVYEVRGAGAKKAREKVAAYRKANAGQAKRAAEERAGSWPEAGEAVVTLSKERASAASPSRVPMRVRPDSKVLTGAGAKARITVLDQRAARRAGVTGVLLTLDADTDAAGRAQVSVDYGSFAGMVGGGWAGRLRLVQLPACALTTPEKDACRTATPLASRNDTKTQTVSAQAPLPASGSGPSARSGAATAAPTVLAVTALAAGSGESPSGTGDYSATELSAASSWEAGGSSGSFTWKHDFPLPPAATDPTPTLSLSYDSGSVDGRTATTNNQGTAVGEGFTLTDSYVERAYGSCDEDGHKDVFDHCWKYDNARLVLNGKSTRLIKDDDSGRWRLEDDDASKVTRSTGADNGDDNGEYWTVVTGDGTKYVFGLNKLDGAGADVRTDSVWTVPVFGDDSGEPGYTKGDGFGDRAVTQAWRWNLDYVENTRGGAATYWYAKETNHYKKNKSETADTPYTRGGYLKEIRYGLRKGALFTDKADAKVTFSHAERCTADDCDKLTADTAKNWPDVPFDAICSDGDKECAAAGPAFFTRKRVTGVSTYSWSAEDAAYRPVDSWSFTQKYLDGGDIGDSSDQTLTLTSLRRTAKAGTEITNPPLSFTYQMRPNRVDATDDILPLTRPRIATITSETGALTTVTLSDEECVRSEVVGAAEDTNTRSCYPQYWNINGAENASVDWFHKYRVLAVSTSDPAGNNDAVENAYDYSGAAWHHSDDPFTPADERTWSDWRGYRQVTVYRGAAGTTRSRTVSLYMQGMDGDKQADGPARSVSVAPLSAPALGLPALTDSPQYAGQLREQVVYSGSTAVSATAHKAWSKRTAHQTVPGAADHDARYVRAGQTTTYTYLTASKSWRSRTVTNSYDDHGMIASVDDTGDTASSGDETCARTWYARNEAAGLTSLVSRTRTVGRPCSVTDASLSLPAGSSERGDVLSDTASVYDDPGARTWKAVQEPVTGQVTWTGRATGYAAAADAQDRRLPTGWQTVSTTAYDALGRTSAVTDAAGRTTTTAYTPAASGPLTKTVVTNPLGHKTTTYLDARRGLAARTYDANNKKTELTYDAMGRLTAVWLPNRSRAAGDSASTTFAYRISAKEPSWVSTAKLKADGKTYNTTYDLYDALLRKLQTQSPTPSGTGRILTDTRYDSRGLAYETSDDIYDSTSAPKGTYTRSEYGESSTQTITEYDGAERETRRTVYFFGEKRWTSTTSYTGDSTATSALKGGTARRVIVDARGRTVETRDYAGQSPADAEYGGTPGVAHTSVRTGYTLDNKERLVTGPDGGRWSYSYDLFGRRTEVTDPDKGTARTEYNALNQAEKVTDATGRSTLTAYDELGRITGTWADSKTPANRLTKHTYDEVVKGKPAESTRYVGGETGKAYTRRVTGYDSLDRAVATELVLPADDALVKAGVPQVVPSTSYYNIDGTLQNSSEPALGGLPAEIVERGYTNLNQVKSINGTTGYLLDTDYSELGQPQRLVLGTADTEEHKKTYVNYNYEEGTGRLLRSRVTDQTHGLVMDLNYTFDEAGNITAVGDSAAAAAGVPETQCFAYDGFRRLTEAWTPSSRDCSDPRSTAGLGGPAPYWTGYTYNDAGQRSTETEHTATGDTTTTYCYTGAARHAVTGTTTKGDCTAPERTYDYTATGNTSSRPGADGTRQELSWSAEGKLSRLTRGTEATDYLYDADGNLLIRSATNGERVLYAGATEVHLRKDGTTWAQRHYGTEETTVALRTNESGSVKLYYLAADHHGTSSLAIEATTQAVVRRYLNAFGEQRARADVGTWVDDRGFLGKTHDEDTGLTHVGAREYDSALGVFISVDPLLETGKHQSLNGYGYAENNPVTLSDPSGQSNQVKCTVGVDCSIDAILADMFVAPPFNPGGNSGSSGTSSGSSVLPPGGLSPSQLQPFQAVPLLLGPDPLPVEYNLDPKITRLIRMMMERQIHNRPPIGQLASDEHGGDGKVRSGGPWNLAFRWLWGSPDLKNNTPGLSFDGDDELTQLLIKSTSMADARSTIAADYAWTGTKKGRQDYSTSQNREKEDLNFLQMAGVYASDLGGLIVGKEDRKAQGILGSYVLDYRITKTKGDTLTVQYTASTDIDNESFLPGPWKWQKRFNKAPQYMGGYFAGFRVEIKWQETIYK
ncbi:RHS repeat-associated core domain-containing protein [Streptomyces salinarius]|uniref:RHS repeat-associated core domain-containing protein n=1 Tax=Streptomyces salinarius TaxID=2762598 RepID=A0ABW8B371_9ACTN